MPLYPRTIFIILIGSLIASCASQKSAPDPARIAEEIAQSRAEELDLVRSAISDPGRAETFVGLLAERDRLLDRVAAEVGEHRDRMAALNADYAAERSDFEALLADYNRRRAAAQTEFVDLITGMKQSTTADEWKVISDFQLDRLNARQLAYRELAGGG